MINKVRVIWKTVVLWNVSGRFEVNVSVSFISETFRYSHSALLQHYAALHSE